MGRALRNIGDLLAMPYGCGEQNMLLFTPNIYILQYLESSGQLSPEIRNRAITFLESGEENQYEIEDRVNTTYKYKYVSIFLFV